MRTATASPRRRALAQVALRGCGCARLGRMLDSQLLVVADPAHRRRSISAASSCWSSAFCCSTISAPTSSQARTQSLTTQADIIAAAIAASADGRHRHDHRRSREAAATRARASAAPAPSDEIRSQFSINPERIGPVLHRLVTPTRTRARIFDRDGLLLLNSQTLSARGADAAPRRRPTPRPRRRGGCAAVDAIAQLRSRAARRRAPSDWATNGKSLPEVAAALAGKTASAVGVDAAGETIVSVGVPIQRADGDARRAAAVDAGRRHRQGDRLASAGRCCASSSCSPR